MKGFTLIELLIATAITMLVIASTFALMATAQGMFAAQPEVSEMQQRLRVAVDALTRDLLMAGAGTYTGSLAGPLGTHFAPVLPYRVGAAGADADGQYFADRLTAVFVPPTHAQSRTADSIASIVSSVGVSAEPGCGPVDPACGFERGMTVLVTDESGAWDTFTVSDVQGSVLLLQHRGPRLSKTYEAGAVIAEVATHTYWLKTDAATDTYQLMRYDGNQSDVPIADNVVGLAFEYFGDDGSGSGSAGLRPLSAAELTDGPWRPDANSPGHYDADLLRVRKIRVTLRVQASTAFRGTAGTLFARSGTTRTSERFLPDQEITFDVTPRNMGPR